MLSEIMPFLAGLVLICAGGDRLLKSAVSLSRRIGIPQIVIGATIVSFCTTLPEMLVSVTAVFDGSPAITVGNAIGSVICNTGLIAGTALLCSHPMKIERPGFLWRSVFFILVLLALMGVACVSGCFSAPVGFSLIVLFVVYALISIFLSGKGDKKNGRTWGSADIFSSDTGMAYDLGIMAVCAVLLFLGARLLVIHGISLAELLGIPERAIAVTAIALGTSLPEFVTTIIALIKHYERISIGNVIGANIMNLLLVIGIPALCSGVELESQTIFIDMPLALLVMLILTVPVIIRKKSSRVQGLILLAIYLLYCVTVL